MNVGTRPRPPEVAPTSADARTRPIILATLGVPFDERASVYAVDTAVQTGASLIVINSTPLQPLRMSLVFGYDALEEFTPEVSASTRRPAELAHSLGARVERIRLRSPRPLAALLELAAERGCGLLVFGPDRAALRERSFLRAMRILREQAACPLWIVHAM